VFDEMKRPSLRDCQRVCSLSSRHADSHTHAHGLAAIEISHAICTMKSFFIGQFS